MCLWSAPSRSSAEIGSVVVPTDNPSMHSVEIKREGHPTNIGGGPDTSPGILTKNMDQNWSTAGSRPVCPPSHFLRASSHPRCLAAERCHHLAAVSPAEHEALRRQLSGQRGALVHGIVSGNSTQHHRKALRPWLLFL